ncbi:hypothetical protein CCUS01_11189 [Colletotrichum cuscutae]|uniref:Uncharacterized protein n=1 Tax=Colletotrichum cuscutae TaxID=1209917 RepID=A0AAI9U3V6_9PEZI|nr:hypothetical protein CCUS01_11189 [Colletotrichum cuscutae]
MARQNQKNETDNPETRISGFWLQRSGSLLASLSCRFFTDLISAGSDQERFLPRPIVFMLGRPTEALYRMECTWDRSAQTQSPGILTWRDGSVIHEWTCTSRIAHRPSPVANGAAASLFPARSARGSHAMSGPADGAHLHHHLPYYVQCLPPKGSPSTAVLSSFTDTQRSTATNLRLEFRGLTHPGLTTGPSLGSMLALSLWPPSNRDDKKRRPLPSRPRDRGQAQLAGGPVLLRLLNPDPFSQDTEWHPKFLNRVAKVLRQKYDGLQIPVLVLAIMAWLRTTPTLKSGTGTGPDSESEAQERGLDDGDGTRPAKPLKFLLAPASSQAPNWVAFGLDHSLILMMRSSMVRFERARRERNATAKDLHNGEQQRKTVKLQGTNWKGQSKLNRREAFVQLLTPYTWTTNDATRQTDARCM